jgi:cation diffusion facilitator CzcD-associated flavoprotein CzcO
MPRKRFLVANVCGRPTALYSFSFAPNYTSTQIYPSGQDYVTYLYDVAERYQVIDKVQLNTDVTEIRYIEQDSEWEVKLSYLLPGTGDLSASERQKRGSVSIKEETVRAKIVISCVGVLVEPNAWPDSVPGKDVFQGDIIHSARWRDEIDLKDKDVIVIGSGCSAAQIVPSLVQMEVKTVTQLMRTPPWVSPRVEEPFGKEAYARYAPTVFRFFPVLGYTMRCIICLFTEILWSTVFQRNNIRLRRMAENSSLTHMRSKVPKKYQKLMTPDYSYGCKRRVFDSDWMESMSSPKFTLTVQPLKRLNARSVSLGRFDGEKAESVQSSDEVHLPADVIVLANGFEATRFLHPLSVYGRLGQAIHDCWAQRGGAQAYMGTAIDGFPNFFMTVGPNTFVGHSSVILGIESTVGYILKLVSPVLDGDILTVEPKKEAALRWTTDIQRSMQKTVFAGCKSWYNDERGWNSTMYPSVIPP